jgi:membrane protease YdiL (CAAX protease family)
MVVHFGKGDTTLKRQYWLVIITYVIMQASSILGVPLLIKLGIGKHADTFKETVGVASGYWVIFSFIVALLIVLYLIRKDFNKDERIAQMPWNIAILWAVMGVFLAMFAQGIAVNIEMRLFGVNPISENTEDIIRLVKLTPILIIVISIIGPILEEIIFRKIIFGTLYQKYNFWIAAIISSVIFALVHMEPKHTLLYAAVGIIFAFLYIKTKRILVPIIAHVSMNTFVIVMQTIFADQIDKVIKHTDQVQSIIGGFM